ncbi:YrrS family protein [Sporosarcina sp. Marseille-Q4063]|uniref:YrrS family protein n=1 Tax=Sporosarcina sp. Marseille-Q4063 TaxID=2810514 RepID=UPI001BAFF980|nr:YrrS family protein [Sporosarcina sp. Marseille-Q4063]QUW22174.1 YrrS family protein [Sporosarcina sp. Marseille-Q4063]
MNKPDNNYSRLNRKRGRNRSDKILNILIAVVVLAIIITASIIFLGGDNKNKADVKLPDTTEENSQDDSTSEETDGTDNIDASSEDEDESANSGDESGTDDEEADETTETKEEEEEADPGVVKYESSDDAVVNETIIKTGWEPIGTSQTGEHVSLYDGKSADWQEKISAISYATELPEDALIIWKIKNGGSPQKSIGIVSTKDKVEKYRVYLEWIDEKGWKPVKMDVLNTLDFDY